MERSDASAILSRLQREGVAAFYHFTDIRNLPGICRTQSLCSKLTLENLGLWPTASPGGNELSHNLDRRNGNWDKVSLSFTPFTPMAYHKKREKHLCFFVVKPEVAVWTGVVFTDSNATTSVNQRRGEGSDGLNLINFEAIRSIPRPGDKNGWVRPVQAEILVPDKIPLQFISEIVFVSEASREHATRIVGDQKHPEFTVNGRVFADLVTSSYRTIGFPHIITLILTDDIVDADTVRLYRPHQNRYYRGYNNSVTLVSLVKVTAGITAGIRWLPKRIDFKTDKFATTDEYYIWSHIPLVEIPDGICSVECHMNKVVWASAEFEVLPYEARQYDESTESFR